MLHPPGDWARGFSHSSHLSQSVTRDVECWIELLAPYHDIQSYWIGLLTAGRGGYLLES